MVPLIGINGLFEVEFQSSAFAEYTLYRGPTVTNINMFVITAVGTGGTMRLTDGNLPEDAAMFYRVQEVPRRILINEIDYDQPGTDASSFIELFNPGPDAVSLANLALVFVNGSNNAEYTRFDLSAAGASLPPGGYLVVRNSTVFVSSGALTLDVQGDFIQNGSPDGVAIIRTSPFAVMDAISYEGSIVAATIDGAPGLVSLVEGEATTALDDSVGTKSLIRSPNGQDTDNASTDWTETTTVTPGAANP